MLKNNEKNPQIILKCRESDSPFFTLETAVLSVLLKGKIVILQHIRLLLQSMVGFKPTTFVLSKTISLLYSKHKGSLRIQVEFPQNMKCENSRSV